MKTILAIILLTSLTGLVQASDVPQFRCTGSEPFWDLQINNQGILTKTDTPDGNEEVYNKTKLTKNDLSSIEIEASNEGNSSLNLKIVKETCDDGMREEIFPYSVQVKNNGKTFKGCCIL